MKKSADVKQEIVMMAIESIHPDPRNAKIHDEASVERLANSIDRLGWRGNPIQVDEDGLILAGHGRRLAALKLGYTKVQVVVHEGLSENDKNLIRVADNRVQSEDWDNDLLKEELLAIEVDDRAFVTTETELKIIDEGLDLANPEAITLNIEGDVENQQNENDEFSDGVDSTGVPIAKAFGFKAVDMRTCRAIKRFMAQLKDEMNEEDGGLALQRYILALEDNS